MTASPNASLFTYPRFMALNTEGYPLAGGKLYSYQAGTLTPQATYTDATLTVPNPNPIILDSFGTAAVWLGSNAYKFNLLDVNGVQQADFPIDNVTGYAQASAAVAATSVLADLASTAAGQGDALVVGLRSETGAIPFSLNSASQQRMLNVQTDFGAVGNGSNPISGVTAYGGNITTGWSLAQWQTIFPFATSLTNELDGLCIQKALNSLVAGQSLYFPHPGTSFYFCNTPLTVTTAYITLLGESQNAGIKFTGSGVCLTVSQTFFSMFSLMLAGNGRAYGAGASGTHGILFQGAGNIDNMLIDDSTIQNFGGDGIHFAGGVYTVGISRSTIQGNAGYGITSEITGSVQNGNALSIFNCGIYGNALDGIRWKASALVVSGCVFEINKGFGIDLTWGNVALSPLPGGFAILGNYFENCLQGCIAMSGSGGVYINGGEISGNYMFLSDAPGGTGAATGPMGVAITATSFINCAGVGSSVDYHMVRNVRIGHNTYSTVNATAGFLAQIAHVAGSHTGGAVFTATSVGTALTVVSLLSGTIAVGQVLQGAGWLPGTVIVSGSGTAWVTNIPATVGAATTVVALGTDNNAFDQTVVIEDNDGIDAHYMYMGDAKLNRVYRSRALSGRVFQTGITWGAAGISNNCYSGTIQYAFFEPQLVAGDVLHQVDIFMETNSTNYTVTIDLQVCDGRTVAAPVTIATFGPTTAQSGNQLITWAVPSTITYRMGTGQRALLRVTLSAMSGGTSFIMHDPIITTN